MINKIRYCVLAFALAACCSTITAQQDSLSLPKKQKKNASKITLLPGPLFGMFGVQQEMKIGKRFSTVTTVKGMPPMKLRVKGANNVTYEGNEYNPFNGLKLFAVGNVTEFRIYGKKKGAMRGFYFGPFVAVTMFKLQSAATRSEFKDDNNVTYYGDVSQALKVTIAGGGLQIGTQGLIKGIIPVDWTILGIGFGTVKLSGEVTATNTSANFDFRNYDEDVEKTTFGLEKFIPFKKTVERENVSLSVKAPVPLFRMSLAIGIAY